MTYRERKDCGRGLGAGRWNSIPVHWRRTRLTPIISRWSSVCLAVEVPLCNQRKRPTTRCPVSSKCTAEALPTALAIRATAGVGQPRLRDARLDSPSRTLVVYSRRCGYGVRYRSPSGPRLPGRVLGVPGAASGRCPCRRYLEGLRRPEGLYVRRAGLPKHGVPPVTCGCARSAVAGRRRGHSGHYRGQAADARHDVVRRCLVHQPEAWVVRWVSSVGWPSP